jgi:hypothetical protein
MAKRRDIVIQNTKEEWCILIDAANQWTRMSRKRKQKETKIRYLYRDSMNLEHGMYDCAPNN